MTLIVMVLDVKQWKRKGDLGSLATPFRKSRLCPMDLYSFIFEWQQSLLLCSLCFFAPTESNETTKSFNYRLFFPFRITNVCNLWWEEGWGWVSLCYIQWRKHIWVTPKIVCSSCALSTCLLLSSIFISLSNPLTVLVIYAKSCL